MASGRSRLEALAELDDLDKLLNERDARLRDAWRCTATRPTRAQPGGTP
jgi:hypothetical protein